jgi:hypothetical protein
MEDSRTEAEKFKDIMAYIKKMVLDKLKEKWEEAAQDLRKLWDWIVSVFNWISEGLTDTWNWIAGALNKLIKLINDTLSSWGIDSGIDLIETKDAKTLKSSEEIEAEAKRDAAEKDLRAETQKILDGMDDM